MDEQEVQSPSYPHKQREREPEEPKKPDEDKKDCGGSEEEVDVRAKRQAERERRRQAHHQRAQEAVATGAAKGITQTQRKSGQ